MREKQWKAVRGSMKIERYKSYITWFYILASFWGIPVYNLGTYDSIGQRKVEVFFLIAGLTLIFYIIVSLIADMKSGDTHVRKKPSFSKTDTAMIIFLCSAAISFAMSEYKEEAAYGIPGFGMGGLSIAVMVLSYFLISRCFVEKEWLYHLIAASAVFPTLLACINRMGYDPLGLYDPGEDPISNLYVSTFGNYSWFSQYLIMIIPLVLYILFTTESIMVKSLYAVYLAVCIWALVVAGTSMAVLAVVITVLAFLLMWLYDRKDRSAGSDKRVKNMATALIVVLYLAYFAFIFFCSRDDFGNGRGYFWGISADLFKELPFIGQIIGVGPDCYMCAVNEYIAVHGEEAARFTEMTQGLALTSSHSEYFDYLINMGIFGCLSYLVVIVFAVRRFLEDGIGNRAKEIAMLCSMAYLIYATANFSTVMSTPYFFICLGILGCKAPGD